MPSEIHSCEAKLPTLIERRESEVVNRNGIPISRILSKSVDESSSSSKSKKLTQMNSQCHLSHDINSNENSFSNEVNKESAPSKEVKCPPQPDSNNNDSITVTDQSTPQPLPKSQSNSPVLPLNNPMKSTQQSRAGSTRSAIAGG